MFGSVQIKQEYSMEDRAHQNVAGNTTIEYPVFNAANITEYPYHQLPYFWNQSHSQSIQYIRDFSQKDGARTPVTSVNLSYVNQVHSVSYTGSQTSNSSNSSGQQNDLNQMNQAGGGNCDQQQQQQRLTSTPAGNEPRFLAGPPSSSVISNNAGANPRHVINSEGRLIANNTETRLANSVISNKNQRQQQQQHPTSLINSEPRLSTGIVATSGTMNDDPRISPDPLAQDHNPSPGIDEQQQQQQQRLQGSVISNLSRLPPGVINNIRSFPPGVINNITRLPSGMINNIRFPVINTLINPSQLAAAQQQQQQQQQQQSPGGSPAAEASTSSATNAPATGPGTGLTASGKRVKCQCEICFKEFGHKSNLFIHMRTHNGERPYKCKECEKCFTHSGNLAIHMRTHSGERPYACQICGKMFSHSGNLSTHLRTHSGVKPYKCKICSKDFRHSGNLSIHERIHSGVKPYHCKVCGKEFYHSGNLTTHMKKHPVTMNADQQQGPQAQMMAGNEFVKDEDSMSMSGVKDDGGVKKYEPMEMSDTKMVVPLLGSEYIYEPAKDGGQNTRVTVMRATNKQAIPVLTSEYITNIGRQKGLIYATTQDPQDPQALLALNHMKNVGANQQHYGNSVISLLNPEYINNAISHIKKSDSPLSITDEPIESKVIPVVLQQEYVCAISKKSDDDVKQRGDNGGHKKNNDSPEQQTVEGNRIISMFQPVYASNLTSQQIKEVQQQQQQEQENNSQVLQQQQQSEYIHNQMKQGQFHNPMQQHPDAMSGNQVKRNESPLICTAQDYSSSITDTIVEVELEASNPS